MWLSADLQQLTDAPKINLNPKCRLQNVPTYTNNKCVQ